MRQQDPQQGDEAKMHRRAQLQQQEVENARAIEAEAEGARQMREKSDHERRREAMELQERRNAEAEDINRRREMGGTRVASAPRQVRPPFKEQTPPPNKQQGSQDLDALPIGQLVALAAAKGITVVRADGKPGKPLKADYIAALTS